MELNRDNAATGVGKVICSCIAIIEIGFVTLSTGTISSAFINKIKNKENLTCQNCGSVVKN